MHDTLPYLQDTDFPPLQRGELKTLQLNLGYLCNQRCLHCHVNAGPNRKELMSWETMQDVLGFATEQGVTQLDLTGGAPELNPHFRRFVRTARAQGLAVMDRCNLTVLSEPGQADLAEFLAEQQVDIIASLPCYLEENVDRQRGDGVFAGSIKGLRALNALGYGDPDGRLSLNLVYNPQGPQLPPSQITLEADYRNRLSEDYGIRFNQLFTIANMPIARFGSTLISRGEFDAYMTLLKDAHQEQNVPHVMCRTLLSIDWQGQVYDCDFNQMLDIPLGETAGAVSLQDLLGRNLEGRPIAIADHCYGCTAGQGSSCGGAL